MSSPMSEQPLAQQFKIEVIPDFPEGVIMFVPPRRVWAGHEEPMEEWARRGALIKGVGVEQPDE